MATAVPTTTPTETNPYGGVNNLYAAGAKIIDNTLNNLFNVFTGDKKKEQELAAKKQEFELALSQLDNQQQYVLSQQLAAAKDDNEKLQILSNAVTQINAGAVTASGSNAKSTALIVLGGAALLFAVIFFIKKKTK